MDDSLLRSLREHATGERIPGTEAEALKALRYSLPETPLARAFLDHVLDGLEPWHQAQLLLDLARLGRQEVLPLLRDRLQTGSAETRLTVAEGIAHLGEPEGLAALERLYHESMRHPRDRERSVPLSWILQDVLSENLGTRAAVALRDKLTSIAKQFDR